MKFLSDDKTIHIPIKDGPEGMTEKKTGRQLAGIIKERKASTKRIRPTQEAYFDHDGAVHMVRFKVDNRVVSTAHTRSRTEQESADDLAQEESWGEYRSKLEAILDDGMVWIMELKPSLFPWKKNLRSNEMDLEDILAMSGDEDLIMD